MKKVILSLLFLSFFSFLSAQDYCEFDGKIIRQINVKTLRVSSEIIKKKFLMKEDEIFCTDNYDTAKQSLHDMRIFKSIDFSVTDNEDESVTIEIDAKDGYYIFPLIFATGGSKNIFAAALIEANLFKSGETAFIFGAFSPDGFSSMGGLSINDNFLSIGYSRMEYKELVYKNGSYSTSGFFVTEPDKDIFGKPKNKYNVRDNSFTVSWSRSFFERAGLSVAFMSSDIKYKGSDTPDDEGKHNKIIFGIKRYKNIRPGVSRAGFGALFGIGLSDIADKLAYLPQKKLGYFAGMSYENGGDHTGSDYVISKMNTNLSGNIEFRSRNMLIADIAGAKDFEAPFFSSIRSGDVLSGRGIYAREFRGSEAVGAGISFVWRPVKNRTGVLSVAPFVENAVIWRNGSPQNHGGAGANVSYQIWKIPFPIGVNYTQNLNDGSRGISFLFGGGF